MSLSRDKTQHAREGCMYTEGRLAGIEFAHNRVAATPPTPKTPKLAPPR